METYEITGTVQSGTGPNAVPVPDAYVSVYATGAGAIRVLGDATTDAAGQFTIRYLSQQTQGIFIAQAKATLGSNVVMVAALGPEIPQSVTINELTTVGAAFSLAQFYGPLIDGDPFGLRIAVGMNDNLVDTRTGELSPVILTSPNADETNSMRSIRALGNLLAGCVRNVPGALGTVLALTTPPQGAEPSSTLEALVNVALYPANNVAGIYTQAQQTEIYTPSLENLPDAWTLAVKVNDSGDVTRMFGGPANIAFDANGYAWVANNVVQGEARSAECIMVLQPNGKPSDGTNGTTVSPVSGGGIKGVGFGISIAPGGNVWVGNFGWGEKRYYPAGTVSELKPNGDAVSPDHGYHGGTFRVQSTVADAAGNIWLASFGNDRLVVYPGGNPDLAVCYPPTDDVPAPGTGPFGIAISGPGEAWVTYAGGLGWPQANTGVLCKYSFSGTALDLTFQMPLGEVTKGMGIDSAGNVWVAAGGHDVPAQDGGDPNLLGSTVYRVSGDGSSVAGYRGGGIDGPWSVAVDGDDNVWVANFGRMGVTSDYTSAGVTKLAGINPPAGYQTGDPISPETGYTLPSAGSPVLLPNGDPLYGPGADPCYSPLMRMTSVIIDRAGNLWAVNNWKPNFATDFEAESGNPGGDGICIFVGVAKPPRTG